MSARAVPISREPPSLLPKLPRAALPAFATVAAVLVLVLGGHALRPALDPVVGSVRVDGELSHLDARKIAAVAGVAPDTHLFELDLDTIRDQVETLPWVAHARVSRVWPDRLAIAVQERQPYARWGATQLLDRESRVFTPAPEEIDQSLPQLNAPEGHEAEAAATFEALRVALASSPFVPSGLSLDPRGEWKLQTARGIELRLGQGDPQARLALIEGAVTTTLAAELDRLAYIDLRYANGFAVGWSARACEAWLHASANARPRMDGPGCSEAGKVPPGTASSAPAKSGELHRPLSGTSAAKDLKR